MSLIRENFYLLACTLLIFYFIPTQSKIPKNVLSFLKNSTTISEVMTKIHLRDPSSRENRSSMIMSDLINIDVALTIPNVGAAHVNSVSQEVITKSDNYMMSTHLPFVDDIEILHDAHQSKDSCKVVEICTALPIQKDANYFYFPECIDLPQCLGGCCDNSRNCHATELQQIKVMVSSFKWAGYVNGQPTFEPGKQLLVDMQKHMRCDCSICILQPDCNSTIHDTTGCQCVCRNLEESANCTKTNFQWSNESCSCECTKFACPEGQILHQNNCTCENNS